MNSLTVSFLPHPDQMLAGLLSIYHHAQLHLFSPGSWPQGEWLCSARCCHQDVLSPQTVSCLPQVFVLVAEASNHKQPIRCQPWECRPEKGVRLAPREQLEAGVLETEWDFRGVLQTSSAQLCKDRKLLPGGDMVRTLLSKALHSGAAASVRANVSSIVSGHVSWP